jgi:hypothetical protein
VATGASTSICLLIEIISTSCAPRWTSAVSDSTTLDVGVTASRQSQDQP